MSNEIYGMRGWTMRPPSGETARLLGPSRNWRQVTLLHNGGAVVSVGQGQSLNPADGGAGFQLVTTVPTVLLIPPKESLYISASAAAQNVSVWVTEIPEAMVPMVLMKGGSR